MTNLEYRNAVYKILGKEPIDSNNTTNGRSDIKKELKKQKRLKDYYISKYKKAFSQR
jgi:hypothetical protein